MRRSRTLVAWSVLALLPTALRPAEAAAQQPTQMFEELLSSGRLELGDSITVIDGKGRWINGTLSDLASDSLAVRRGDAEWTVTEGDVLRIVRADSAENGAWIGGGIAAGAFTAACKLRYSDDECGYLAMYYFWPAIGLGALTGFIIDDKLRETLYEAPSARRLTWAPVISRRAWGARLRLQW